jgi:hypothetical protein
MLAAAGAQFLRVPTVFADWVTPRDGARVVAFALLLGAAWCRYEKLRRDEVSAAMSSERERIARDLHDGLAQDLVCITTQGQRLDCHLEPGHPLMLASRDALAEVRGIIAELTGSIAPSTADTGTPRTITRELERRLDIKVSRGTDPEAGSTGEGDGPLGPPEELAGRVSVGAGGVLTPPRSAGGTRKPHRGGLGRRSTDSSRAGRRRPA